MCPSHLSESLLLDRLRYIVMLSSTYRNQPFFYQFFSPLLRLLTLPPSKNCLSAPLLGYVYPAPCLMLVLMLVLNFSIQLCSKDEHSCIGEKQSSNVCLIMILIDVGATRYTGEGMDIMEFTEAESNIHDLM